MKTATFSALAFVLVIGTASAQTPVGTSGTSSPSGTTATGTTGAATAAAANTSSDYRLGPGDKLRIEVYKDAQLSQTLQVRPDGKVTMPLVGDIAAAGKTSTELGTTISKVLTENKYIADPVVTVIITETAPQYVFVQGEVNKPGQYTLVNGQLSIFQALAMAGGFTDFANKKDITVIRRGPTGTQQRLKFNYKEALDSLKEPLQLQSGDTVVVK